MTYALREACSLTAHALAALIAQQIALTALAALGLSKDPFHEPFHDRGLTSGRPVHCAYRHRRRRLGGLIRERTQVAYGDRIFAGPGVAL